ncbi:hypothetical protein MEM_05091, partial [Candida albicans L26]
PQIYYFFFLLLSTIDGNGDCVDDVVDDVVDDGKELNEQKKFHGTKVTKQSWLNWRNNFRKEMKYELYDKQRFEKGLANQNDDDEEEEGENQTIQEQEKDIVDGIKRL